MNEKKPEEILENLTELDAARIKRLKVRGHYYSLLDEYEQLRLKFYHEKTMDKDEAIRLVTLCKFFMENGHSDSFKLSCKYLYEKYIGKFGL